METRVSLRSFVSYCRIHKLHNVNKSQIYINCESHVFFLSIWYYLFLYYLFSLLLNDCHNLLDHELLQKLFYSILRFYSNFTQFNNSSVLQLYNFQLYGNDLLLYHLQHQIIYHKSSNYYLIEIFLLLL